jgi:deazaflavin-dependent oxidoreductase (nitroreductase family)
MGGGTSRPPFVQDEFVVGRYADSIKRLGHRRWFAWVGSRVAPRADRVLYRFTGGRITATGKPVIPTLLLTTTGRKSGQPRTVPLLFVHDGQRMVVAGSNWGQAHDPDWALNLAARPTARVQIGHSTFDVVARQAGAEEKQRLWAELDRAWPAYDTYRKRSGRDIRVFVLEPATLTDAT